MTSDDYRTTLATLGLTQNAGGELLGVDPRTSRKWANGERDIPPPASRFLRYLVHLGADPAKVRAILDGGEAPSVSTDVDPLAIPAGARVALGPKKGEALHPPGIADIDRREGGR